MSGLRHGGDRRSYKALVHHPGNPLWEYRKRLGLTQQKLAEQMFVSQEVISDMEIGRRKVSDYVIGWMKEHQNGDESDA